MTNYNPAILFFLAKITKGQDGDFKAEMEKTQSNNTSTNNGSGTTNTLPYLGQNRTSGLVSPSFLEELSGLIQDKQFKQKAIVIDLVIAEWEELFA